MVELATMLQRDLQATLSPSSQSALAGDVFLGYSPVETTDTTTLDIDSCGGIPSCSCRQLSQRLSLKDPSLMATPDPYSAHSILAEALLSHMAKLKWSSGSHTHPCEASITDCHLIGEADAERSTAS